MLILIAHGSRNPRWRSAVERLAESLQAESGRANVSFAYMEFTPPTLADAVSDAVRAGAKRVRVLPLFVANEGHVDKDIRPVVEQLREQHAPVRVELLPAVGQHPLFLEMLNKIALEAE